MLTNTKELCILNLMKGFLVFIVAFLSFLANSNSAYAQELIACPQPPFDFLCFNEASVPGVIGAAITFIFVITIIIAVFYLLFGAVKWIFSGGDKSAVEGARSTIVAALVGLLIVFLVFLVFAVLLRFFGVAIGDITNIPGIQP